MGRVLLRLGFLSDSRIVSFCFSFGRVVRYTSSRKAKSYATTTAYLYERVCRNDTPSPSLVDMRNFYWATASAGAAWALGASSMPSTLMVKMRVLNGVILSLPCAP